MAIAPAGLVIGAARSPLPYGLFSVVPFRPGGDRWEAGTQWEAGTCDPADGIGGYDCADPGDTVGLPKNLATNNGGVGSASQFTIYGHFNCSPVGYTQESAEGLAVAHLLAREEARVEQALWTGDLGNTPAFEDTGTTTLGTGPVAPKTGLALLEQWIGAVYGSLGVIHLTRFAASLLSGSLTSSGGRLATKLGTPVVAGAGYPGTGPAGEPATATAQWAYATPALFGYRSDVFTPSNNRGDLLDRGVNDLYAVAERSYLLGYDPCGVAAAQLDLTP